MTPRGARETISLVSRAREPLACTVTVELDADLAAIGEVKAGRPAATPPPHPDLGEPGTVRWQIGRDAAVLATLSPEPYGVRTAAPSRVLARWEVALPVRGRWSATLEVTAVAPGRPAVAAPPTRELWSPVRVDAGDHRLPALVDRAVADLTGLLVADPEAPDDHYLDRRRALVPHALRPGLDLGRPDGPAAGHRPRRRHAADAGPPAGRPGRPAHRGGAGQDPARGARDDLGLGDVRLPPLYYGTVDATPLWICLLHDAWRWGLPAEEVEALLPHAGGRAGLAARPRRRGRRRLLRVRRQHRPGWPTRAGRTRGDSVQFADGRLAEPPIALCEVQAYAYEAAMAGAALLDAFGRPGGRAAGGTGPPALRGPVPGPRSGSRTPGGRYPAIALDGAGGRSTRSPPTSATCSAPGCWTRPRPARWSRRLAGAGHGLRLRAADDVRRARPGTTRSATTAARSGRTTPRSRCAAWPRSAPATPTRPAA